MLEANSITPYRLAEEARGLVNRNTVYAVARGDSARVDLSTLDGLIGTLRRLTGKPVSVCDLLEYQEGE